VTTIPSSANLYLVNVKGEETSYYQKTHKKTSTVQFSGIKNVKKNSYVLVEDVISMKKEEEINLRNAINYTVHHNKSKLFCVSHTITKTGLYSMVGLFNYIIFTGSPSNLPVIRTCLRYFKIETEKVNKWLSCIKKEAKRNPSNWDPYYFFDCTKMIFCSALDLLNLSHPESRLRILGTLNESSSEEEDDDDDDDDDDDENFFRNRLEALSSSKINQSGGRRAKVGGGGATTSKALAPGSSKQIFVKGGGLTYDGSKNKATKKQKSLSMVALPPSLSSLEVKLKSLQAKKLARKSAALKEKKLELVKKNFSNFFSGHELSNQACAIFSLIVEKLDPNRVDSSDLSITFRSRNSGKAKKISLVDYIACLLVPNKPPPLDHLVLHNFITSKCVLPVSCIRNENFLGLKK